MALVCNFHCSGSSLAKLCFNIVEFYDARPYKCGSFGLCSIKCHMIFSRKISLAKVATPLAKARVSCITHRKQLWHAFENDYATDKGLHRWEATLPLRLPFYRLPSSIAQTKKPFTIETIHFHLAHQFRHQFFNFETRMRNMRLFYGFIILLDSLVPEYLFSKLLLFIRLLCGIHSSFGFRLSIFRFLCIFQENTHTHTTHKRNVGAENDIRTTTVIRSSISVALINN